MIKLWRRKESVGKRMEPNGSEHGKLSVYPAVKWIEEKVRSSRHHEKEKMPLVKSEVFLPTGSRSYST